MRKMKDSGVPWIGKIPDDWSVGKIKFFFSITLGKMLTPQPSSTTDSLEAYLCAQNITENGLRLDTIKQMWFSEEEKKSLKLQKGDILVVEGGNIGLSCIYNDEIKECYIQNALHRLTSNSYYENKFLYYWMKFVEKSQYLSLICNKATIAHYTKERVGNTPIVIVSNEAQQRITSFLDTKCSKIDSTITNIRALIEKLKEYKQSVITQAVTKGLDPDAPMKDSGVPWIGEIPKNIKLSRVGLHYNLILGKMICSIKPDNNYTLEHYYCAVNVHFDGITKDELKEMWFNDDEKKQYKVNNGDLLIVEGGAGSGGAAIVNDIQDDIYIQNSIIIARNNNSNDNRYLRYLIEFLVVSGYIDFVCNKATIPHFTKDKVANIPYPVFSESDRISISDYLDNKCAKIDSQIAEQESLLTKLGAYKKSLIYECVTGKREVPASFADAS